MLSGKSPSDAIVLASVVRRVLWLALVGEGALLVCCLVKTIHILHDKLVLIVNESWLLHVENM